jgi:hypothetical protein
MFSRRHSSKFSSDYIAKINSSIIIIQTAIINNSSVYDFITSIASAYLVRLISIIQDADSNITIPQNKADIDNVSEITAAIVEITTLVNLLSTFYYYLPGAKFKGDIIVDNVNVSEIKDIVPYILTNKQAIIGNIFDAYTSNEDDIEFYDIYIDRNKVFTQYASLTNSMATGPKTTKHRRHKRGYKRSYKRSAKRSYKRSYKQGYKRSYKRRQ